MMYRLLCPKIEPAISSRFFLRVRPSTTASLNAVKSLPKSVARIVTTNFIICLSTEEARVLDFRRDNLRHFALFTGRVTSTSRSSHKYRTGDTHTIKQWHGHTVNNFIRTPVRVYELTSGIVKFYTRSTINPRWTMVQCAVPIRMHRFYGLGKKKIGDSCGLTGNSCLHHRIASKLLPL